MTEAELNRKFNPMDFQQTLHQLPQYVANRPRGEERDLDPSLISRFTPAEDIASAAMQEEVASDQRAQKAAAGNILTNPGIIFPDLRDVQSAHIAQPPWEGFGTLASPSALPSSPEEALQSLPVPASTQPNQPAAAIPAPGLNRLAAQKDYTPPPAIQYKGGRRLLEDALQLYPNTGAATLTAAGKDSDRNKEIAALSAQGYRPLELPGSSPNALPTGVMRQQGQGVKGSALPELQAQYAKQGIEFDPNAMYEQMNYAIPGAKGSASGWRKVDPNRQQGSFSVVPGLSDADQQRYKEIVANETRQREYAQGRGKEWDAAQAAQASNAVAALKQMYDREQFNQTQATAQAGHEETKRKNRSDEDWKAAKLEQSIAAEKNQAQKFDPKLIPTVASILEAEQKNAPLGNKLTREQHLSNGLLNYGIKTATDIKNPPDGLFILPDNPDQVFMRDPKTKTVTALSSLDDHLKQWARNRYAGMGTPTVAPAESVQP